MLAYFTRKCVLLISPGPAARRPGHGRRFAANNASRWCARRLHLDIRAPGAPRPGRHAGAQRLITLGGGVPRHPSPGAWSRARRPTARPARRRSARRRRCPAARRCATCCRTRRRSSWPRCGATCSVCRRPASSSRPTRGRPSCCARSRGARGRPPQGKPLRPGRLGVAPGRPSCCARGGPAGRRLAFPGRRPARRAAARGAAGRARRAAALLGSPCGVHHVGDNTRL
jgi:hypothetical protein